MAAIGTSAVADAIAHGAMFPDAAGATLGGDCGLGVPGIPEICFELTTPGADDNAAALGGTTGEAAETSSLDAPQPCAYEERHQQYL